MFLQTVLLVTLVGLTRSQTTFSPFFFPDNFPGELEWDCTDDHLPHPTDQRKFLQSPNGFNNDSDIVTSQCPAKFQVFSQERGLCRCVYMEELRLLLAEPCQFKVRAESPPQVYYQLIPALGGDTIEDLYVERTCYDLMPQNVVSFFSDLGINPLFFNETSCRCESTPEAEEVQERPIARGRRCETLVDQTFRTVIVESDVVGNWVEVFPSNYQVNMTLRNGGAVFGEGVYSTVHRRLTGTDFRELTIVAKFQAESGNEDQIIFTNLCGNSVTEELTELLFNPSSRQFSLRFFGDQVATCIPPTSSNGFAEQMVQVIYRHGVVRLVVNDFECDMGFLNPVTAVSNSRLVFNPDCPMQIGGAVVLDFDNIDFGKPMNRPEKGFRGVFQNFMALRNCDSIPKEIQDRMNGVTSSE